MLTNKFRIFLNVSTALFGIHSVVVDSLNEKLVCWSEKPIITSCSLNELKMIAGKIADCVEEDILADDGTPVLEETDD